MEMYLRRIVDSWRSWELKLETLKINGPPDFYSTQMESGGAGSPLSAQVLIPPPKTL
jgi:hypothetical protein